METKKVLSLIFSILFVCAFGFVLSWGIINFNKVKDGMSGTELYTKEDLNNAYNDGYDTALEDKEEYTELINSYRDTITTLNDNISQLNSQINILTSNNKDYANQVTKLETQKSNLQEQVTNLTTIKANNEETITQLNSQITTLQNDVAELEKDNDNKDTTIEQKNSQIASLQTTVSQLQRTNELNNETITNLNNQILSLNSQITDMTMQIQNNSSNVTALNNKIAELEKSVSYYEQYIANLENGEQVVATFEFNGSVYNIQIVNKNDTVSVVNPTSTDYIIFNYWTVGGEKVDLSTYKITTNTKIVADITYKYDVNFMVDNETYNNQIVIKNGYATPPTNPTKDGYEFDGWTTNGVDIISNINTTVVTQNVTYYAKFTKLHTVTFMYEGAIKNTQTVKNGETATNITVDSTRDKVFNGWKLNDVIVDITSQKIFADTTFIADITYWYYVYFKVDDIIYSGFLIKEGYCCDELPTDPTKTGYLFKGWSLDGVDIVSNITTTVVTQHTTYVAIFEECCIFDSDYFTQLSVMDSNITKENISSISFLYESNKTDRLGTLSSGIDVYYSLDDSGYYELDFIAKKIYAPKNCSSLFEKFISLTTLDLSNFNTAIVNGMGNMFFNCESLTTLDLSDFDTSNVTNMSGMFSGCDSLTTLDLSNFDTSKVVVMSHMFFNCESLTTLDLSNFDTFNVTSMDFMFFNCESLTTLDLSDFNTSNVTRMGYMFGSCSCLEIVIVGENYTLDNLPV